MKGENILITGAAGSVGSELTRQLAPQNRILAIDIDETRLFDLTEELSQRGFDVFGKVLDVRSERLLDEISDGTPLSVIFHAAARKHVSPMEITPLEAVSVNIIGTWNVIRLAKEKGVKTFINISTDKVVNSHSIMGATKKVAEIMVKNAGFISIRFGNVLGSRGSVIPIWQRQVDRGDPITITDERMVRYFMSIEEACSLIIKASEVGKPGDILIMDMGEPVNILKIAKEILGKIGRVDYPIKSIGIRPGELLSEQLMSKYEESVAQKESNFYIIEKTN